MLLPMFQKSARAVLLTPYRSLSLPVSPTQNERVVWDGRTNEDGINLIKSFESCHLEAYHDPVGYPTQGWGRLLSLKKWEDLSKWPAISQDTANRWLVDDLKKTESQVRALITADINADMFSALVSFTYNLGSGNLQASTLRRKINRGEPETAISEFVRWNKAGGKVYRGLTRRRIEEAKLFKRGVDILN